MSYLEFARHTRRDFITLLNCVQKEDAKERQSSSSALEQAVTNYSMSYFMPEIRDELRGYFKPDEITQIISLLGGIGECEFAYNQVVRASEHVAGTGLGIKKVCSDYLNAVL